MDKILFTAIFSVILGIFLSKDSIRPLIYKYSDWLTNEETDEVFQLATINLSESRKDFASVSRKVTHAFKTVGFAYVESVEDFDPDELLFWTKWFFDLPQHVKMDIAKLAFNEGNPNVYRGYFPVIPGGNSYKEAFEIGLFERATFSWQKARDADIRNLSLSEDNKPYMRTIVQEKNVWPISGNEVEDRVFRQMMTKYLKIYFETITEIFQMLIHGLGLEKSSFDHLFGNESLSTFRLIHYPSRLETEIPAEGYADGLPVVTGEHFDSTMLTILCTFDNGGLQIKPKGSSKWIDVPADKHKFVINAGALLSAMSEGKIVATNHRVLDIGKDRYSLPLFLEPRFDGDISKTFFGDVNSFVGKYSRYGPYLVNRTSMFAEYATTEFGIED